MRKNPQPLTKIGQGVKKFTAENSAAKFYPNQIAYLRGKRYENEKRIWGGDRGNQYTKAASVQIEHLTKPTSKKLGEEYGVSKSTIQRNEQFAKTVDILPQKVKDDVLANKISITQAEARAVSMMDKPTQKKFLKEVESGTPIKEAVKKL